MIQGSSCPNLITSSGDGQLVQQAGIVLGGDGGGQGSEGGFGAGPFGVAGADAGAVGGGGRVGGVGGCFEFGDQAAFGGVDAGQFVVSAVRRSRSSRQLLIRRVSTTTTPGTGQPGACLLP